MVMLHICGSVNAAYNGGELGALYGEILSMLNCFRFQKMVEIAPSTIQDRALVSTVIRSALKMARAVGVID